MKEEVEAQALLLWVILVHKALKAGGASDVRACVGLPCSRCGLKAGLLLSFDERSAVIRLVVRLCGPTFFHLFPDLVRYSAIALPVAACSVDGPFAAQLLQ